MEEYNVKNDKNNGSKQSGIKIFMYICRQKRKSINICSNP